MAKALVIVDRGVVFPGAPPPVVCADIQADCGIVPGTTYLSTVTNFSGTWGNHIYNLGSGTWEVQYGLGGVSTALGCSGTTCEIDTGNCFPFPCELFQLGMICQGATDPQNPFGVDGFFAGFVNHNDNAASGWVKLNGCPPGSWQLGPNGTTGGYSVTGPI